MWENDRLKASPLRLPSPIQWKKKAPRHLPTEENILSNGVMMAVVILHDNQSVISGGEIGGESSEKEALLWKYPRPVRGSVLYLFLIHICILSDRTEKKRKEKFYRSFSFFSFYAFLPFFFFGISCAFFFL